MEDSTLLWINQRYQLWLFTFSLKEFVQKKKNFNPESLIKSEKKITLFFYDDFGNKTIFTNSDVKLHFSFSHFEPIFFFSWTHSATRSRSPSASGKWQWMCEENQRSYRKDFHFTRQQFLRRRWRGPWCLSGKLSMSFDFCSSLKDGLSRDDSKSTYSDLNLNVNPFWKKKKNPNNRIWTWFDSTLEKK